MSSFTAGKLRYLVPALLAMLFIGILVAGIRDMYPGPPSDPVSIALFGEWIGPKGQSITFREDGTALGLASDGVTSDEYLWWVDEGILTFRRIRDEPSYKKMVRNLFELLPGARRLEWKILELTEDSLTLLALDTNKAITFNRSDKESD